MSLELDIKSTALVLIDLQRAIVGRPLQPHSAADVVSRCAGLAAAFRDKGAPVVYVNVDLSNMQSLPVDEPSRKPGDPLPPASASEIVPEAGLQPGDLRITKRSWGAFGGTDLEKHFRDRGIKTMVIAGIATDMGVESTARAANGLGFAVVFVEDAMSTMSEEMHKFAVEKIFPRQGRVRSATQVQAALA